MLATIRRREIIDRDDFPVPKENDSDYHIDIGKLNTFIKSQPYSPNGQEVASANLSPQNLYHYYSKGTIGDMPIKTAISLKDLWISMKQNNGPLEPSSRVLDVKELERFLYSGMITGYAIAKTGLMNATNGNLYIRGKRPIDPCNWIVPSVSINT